jgi:hypothetical protein
MVEGYSWFKKMDFKFFWIKFNSCVNIAAQINTNVMCIL